MIYDVIVDHTSEGFTASSNSGHVHNTYRDAYAEAYECAAHLGVEVVVTRAADTARLAD